MKKIEISFDKFIQKYKILNKKIIVAFSGGRDSVALFDLLYKNREKYNLQLIIAYINHNLRGADSKIESYFVENFARERNIEIRVKSIEPSFWKEKSGESIEMRARSVRYGYFNEIAQKESADYIATAHQLDDKIETFFINILRSSGTEILSSIPEKSGNIIRPLLNVSRKEIDEYVEGAGLKYIDDKTNFENKYFRNKIRNDLIPVLEKIKPEYRKNFSAIFRHFDEERMFKLTVGKKALKRILIYADIKNISINYAKFARLKPSLRKIVAKIILKKIGYPAKPNLIMLDILSKALKNERIVYHKSNLLMQSKSDRLFFTNVSVREDFSVSINKLPVEIDAGSYGVRFIEEKLVKDYKSVFCFRYDEKSFPLTARNLTKNDALFIQNKKRKIIDILPDFKIPKNLISSGLAICDNQEKIIGFYILGTFRVSERYYANQSGSVVIGEKL